MEARRAARRRGHRLRRGRAAALQLLRPGLARRHDADGRPPRRRPRRGRGGARDRADPGGRGRRRDDRRAASRARDPDRGRRRARRSRSTCAIPTPRRWRGCSRRPARPCERPRRARGCELAEAPLWRIEPIPFDAGPRRRRAPGLRARSTGEPAELASGALHDAAEVARVLPAAMLFAPSRRGISHAPRGGHRRGRPGGRDRGLRALAARRRRARAWRTLKLLQTFINS